MREVESSVWLVQFSDLYQSSDQSKPWRRNYDLLVVASTLERAVEGVREKHPDATFHSVHRRGTDKTLFVVDAGSGDNRD